MTRELRRNERAALAMWAYTCATAAVIARQCGMSNGAVQKLAYGSGIIRPAKPVPAPKKRSLPRPPRASRYERSPYNERRRAGEAS